VSDIDTGIVDGLKVRRLEKRGLYALGGQCGVKNFISPLWVPALFERQAQTPRYRL
jgi:hypothetical protein